MSGSLLVLRRGPARGARPRPGARVASIGLLGALALLSLILTANSDAFDGARWRAGRHAVGRGLPAVAVDAGFEWVGSHALGVADEAREGTGPNRSWWANMLGGPRVCEIVASSPTLLPGYSPTGTVAWRTWLVAGRAHLAIYTDTSGCGAAVPGP